MLTFGIPTGASRTPAGLAIRAAIVAGCALFVCACNTDQQVAAAPDVPFDYRLRHPISITETQHNVEIFVGSNRGELNASQRAALVEFAENWKHEATGGVVVNDARRQQQPARRGGGGAGDLRDSHGRRRTCERNTDAGISSAARHASNDPRDLSEDWRPGGTMRLLARGHRTERESRLFRKRAAMEPRLRHPTQSCRHGRQSGGFGAAAGRRPGLRNAPHQRHDQLREGWRHHHKISGKRERTDQRPRSMITLNNGLA